MRPEETIIGQSNNAKTFKSVSNDKILTLTDPITQICKRLEAFFKADENVTCRYIVNNNKSLGPKLDPDTGEIITKKVETNDGWVDALVEQDHFCEFRVFVDNVEKAQCLSNVIRHRHTIPEIYVAASDGSIHYRDHFLLVRVCTVDAVDPDGSGGGNDPWITDDDTDKGVKEIFGLEPIDWNDTNTGCHERLAPSDISESDIPKGVPEEYEQMQWEVNLQMCKWKWKWLKTALKGNKNIIKTFDVGDYYFIECNYLPVVFLESNLTSSKGYNSILPADLLPLIFPTFGGFQISTYVYK